MEHSKTDMRAMVRYDEPKDVTRLKVTPDLKKMGPLFGKKTPSIITALDNLEKGMAQKLQKGENIELNIDGETKTIESGLVSVEEVTEKELKKLSDALQLDEKLEDLP